MWTRLLWQQARQHRQLDVVLLRDVGQRAQILGQAGAAEGETGLQVGRRNVQALVGAHQAHDLVRVDAQRLRDAADFVGEGDLERVKGIAAHLERLGHANVRDQEACIEMLEQIAHRIDRGFAIAADDRVRRMIVVADRGALAQELRLEAQTEVDARLLAAGALENWLYLLFHRARLNRRADDDGVELLLERQRRTELLGEPQDRGEVLAAVRGRRRAHAHERDFGIAHGQHGIVGHRDAAGIDHVAHQFLDAFFEDGRLATANQVELHGIDVDADHLVSVTREASQRHCADVAQAEDADAPADDRAATFVRQASGSIFVFENGA